MNNAILSSIIDGPHIIEVSDTLKTPKNISPGTLFIPGYFNWNNYRGDNMIAAVGCIIRFGKKGKERIVRANFDVPIFYTKNKSWEQLIKQTDRTSIFPEELTYFDTFENLTGIEFAGIAIAQLEKLKILSSFAKRKVQPIGINKQGHPFKAVNTLDVLISADRKLFDKLVEDKDFRFSFFKEKAKQEAAYKKLLFAYNKLLSTIERRAAELLLFAQSKGLNLAEDEVIEATYAYHLDKESSYSQQGL